jgi:hypothetical protein
MFKILKSAVRMSSQTSGQGIIFGHGIQVPGRLCRVPENLWLRPTCPHNTTTTNQVIYHTEESEDTKPVWKATRQRNLVSDFTQSDQTEYANYYYPTQLIPDLKIQFKSTWTDDDAPSQIACYSLTGIVTGNISKETELITNVKPGVTEEMVKRDSLKCHNIPLMVNSKGRQINNDIWGETIYLSQVLTAISASVRKNPSLPKIYWLQVCRSGSLVNIECESGQVRELSGGASTPDIPPPPPLPSLLRLRTLSANDPSSPLTLFYLKCLFYREYMIPGNWGNQVISDIYCGPGPWSVGRTHNPNPLCKIIDSQVTAITQEILVQMTEENYLNFPQYCYLNAFMTGQLPSSWNEQIKKLQRKFARGTTLLPAEVARFTRP